MRRQRVMALLALVALAVGLVAALAVSATAFPRGLLTFAFVAAALLLGGRAWLHRGARRWAGLLVAALMAAAAVALIVIEGPVGGVVVVLPLVVALAAARAAFTSRAHLPRAPRPTKAVVFWNPKSGGGKATKANLADEARKRGIEAVELHLGDDLHALVDAAVAGGADALAAAGGDGTQAIVAAAAAEHGLPYACIPAGTRNHFALDLGVDRDDVVGALDALVDGRERRVDLASVNGQVFVNNVSLGIYAEAVQREGYREAKLRTISRAIPDALGSDGAPSDLRWTGPDGREHQTGAVILVSNNPYRFRAVGAGSRPRMDTGELGVAVFDPGERRAEGGHSATQFATPIFEVHSAGPVPAGLDGEAVTLPAPVRFASRPGALIVRIAPHHPGASPAANLPESLPDAARRLVALCSGRAA